MSNPYSIPSGLRVYAIGDLHGMMQKLERMHEAISEDLIESPPEDVHIVYMGDYVDRGPDSRDVIEALIARRDRGDGVKKSFLLGNHEKGMLSFLNAETGSDVWLDWGGIETMRSYGIELPGETILLPAERERAQELLYPNVPEEHVAFLYALDPYVEIGGYVFCHAGLQPHVPMVEQAVEDLTFMREPFLSYDKAEDYEPLPARVVHGHTISELPEIKKHRVGIDTGAYEEGGKLTCGVFEGRSVRFLQV